MADTRELDENWDKFAQSDATWAILKVSGRNQDRWSIDRFFESGRAEIESVMNLVGKLGINHGTESALDFGCGIGRLTQAIAVHFNTCLGIDVSHSMISQARTHNRMGERCVFKINRGLTLRGIPDESFDFIYTCRVLQHMKRELSKEYIIEFTRTLRPGGVLAFQVPSSVVSWKASLMRSMANSSHLRKLGELYSKLRYGVSAVMEMHCIERGIVEKLLEDGGCRLVHAERTDAAGSGYLDFLYVATKN